MPQAPSPNSSGQPEANGPGQANKLPYGKPGGEIILSREEAMALTALETDEGPNAMKRASAESGLDSATVKRLQKRAEKARREGYTLKGGNITLKPKNYEPDSGPGLLGDIMGSQKNVGKATKGTPAKSDSAAAATTTKTKEARRLHECGSAPCAPCAARARRARLALTEAMRRRSTKVKGRSTCY